MIGPIERLSDRLMRRFLLLGLAACLALGALGVGAAGLYQWLLVWMLPAASLGVVALVLLALTLLVLAAVLIDARTPRPATLQAAEADFVSALTTTVGDIAGGAVRADPLGAVLCAGALGFILESRPELDRALLRQLLRQLRIQH